MINSKKEFLKALIDGRRFKLKNEESYFYYYDEIVPDDETPFRFGFIDEDGEFSSSPLDINSCNAFEYVEEIIVKPWYEDIPEKGVLCKVWNDDNPPELILINKLYGEYGEDCVYKFEGTNCSIWQNAEPLTIGSVKEYIYKEKDLFN